MTDRPILARMRNVSDKICNSINVTQYTSAKFFILKQGYMFRLEVSHLQALTTFRYQMLCPLWDPVVFTVVEYI